MMSCWVTCSQTKAKSLLFPRAEMTLLQTSEPRHSRCRPLPLLRDRLVSQRRLTTQQRIEEKLAASSIPFLGTQPAKHAGILNDQALEAAMSWKCACGQPCDSVSKALLRTLRTAYLDLGGEHVQSEHLIQLRALVDFSTGQDRYPLGLDTGFVCRATFLHCLGISETELAGAAVLHKGGTQFVAQAQEREALKHTHAEAR